LQVQERPPSLVQEKLPALVQEMVLFQVLVMFLLQVLVILLLLEQVKSPFQAVVMQLSLVQEEMPLSQAQEKPLLKEEVTVPWHQMPPSSLQPL